MTTRKSKIARLPFRIREMLNHRIMDNVPTKEILIWLNTDGTVRRGDLHLANVWKNGGKHPPHEKRTQGDQTFLIQ